MSTAILYVARPVTHAVFSFSLRRAARSFTVASRATLDLLRYTHGGKKGREWVAENGVGQRLPHQKKRALVGPAACWGDTRNSGVGVSSGAPQNEVSR